MKRTRGKQLVAMVLNEPQDRESSVSPLPPGAEFLQGEIDFLGNIDLDALEPEHFSETMLFEGIMPLEHSDASDNSVPHSTEYETISVVADVHERNMSLGTRRVLQPLQNVELPMPLEHSDALNNSVLHSTEYETISVVADVHEPNINLGTRRVLQPLQNVELPMPLEHSDALNNSVPHSTEYETISVVADVHEPNINLGTRRVLQPLQNVELPMPLEHSDALNNSVPHSTEYETISVVADVHEPNINLGTRRVLQPLQNVELPKENSPELTRVTPMPSPSMAFSPVDTNIICSEIGNDDSPAPTIYTDSPASTPGARKRKFQKKKDLGNLRETYKDMWVDEKRKYNVNHGLKYTSRSGKEKPQKTVKSPCPITCKKKCSIHFSQSEREKIFEMFWKIGNHTRQWDFITKYAKRGNRNRVTKLDSKRTCTIKYFFPQKDENTDAITVKPVCKLMFLNTLGISWNFVNTALNKFYKGNGTIEPDSRGKHNSHPKFITPDIIKSVCDHVKSFAPVESHYTRKRSSKLYLDTTLTFPKMFVLYTEWFDITKYAEKAISVRQYRDIAQKNFNLAFHIPKKDICDACHIYDNLTDPSDDQKSKHIWHLEEKNRARDLKKQDKEISTLNKHIVTVAFDLQKTLTTPHGNISVFYYKRKLNVYNFTAFDLGARQGYCYCWHEQIAKKGANEIASNILKLIQLKVLDNVKEFRFWSDNCGGQNRNRIVFLMYMYACWKYNITITHRFLVVGHTQNEGDSMHALIEKKMKNINVYTPEQWYMAFRMAKTDKPYEVTEVSQELIYDFKACLRLFNNWKKGTNGETVMWSQVCEIHVSRDEPFKIQYKNTFEDETSKSIECFSTKNTRNRQNEVTIGLNNINLAYHEPLPIDKQKYKDLNNLCQSGIIPARHHDFYKTLVSKSDNKENDANDSE